MMIENDHCTFARPDGRVSSALPCPRLRVSGPEGYIPGYRAGLHRVSESRSLSMQPLGLFGHLEATRIGDLPRNQ